MRQPVHRSPPPAGRVDKVCEGKGRVRADARLERLLRSLEGQPAEALSDLLFSYRFERYGLRALPYLLGWS